MLFSSCFRCKESNERLPLSSLCDGKFDCLDFSDECNSKCRKEIINSIWLRIFSWTIGVSACILNGIIVYKNAVSIPSTGSFASLLNKTLILIIASGDLIQGVYLLAISYIDITSRNYCENQFNWLTSQSCATIGVLSTLASQLSLFSMSILGLSRLVRMTSISIGGDVSRKAIISLVAIVVMITGSSLVIAVIPLLPKLENFFVNGIYYPNNRLFIGAVSKPHHLEILQGYYGRLRGKYISWHAISNLVDNMFSSDYSAINRKTLHFYGNDGVCLFKYFVTPTDPQRTFSWAILAVNFVCFMAITASYIFINFVSITSTNQFRESAQMKHIRQRNTRLQRKISFIIATDFLCWVPFLIMCFLHSLLVIDASNYYSFFSIVVLPINSVINPLLYDDSISNIIRKISGIRTVTLYEKSVFILDTIARRKMSTVTGPTSKINSTTARNGSVFVNRGKFDIELQGRMSTESTMRVLADLAVDSKITLARKSNVISPNVGTSSETEPSTTSNDSSGREKVYEETQLGDADSIEATKDDDSEQSNDDEK